MYMTRIDTSCVSRRFRCPGQNGTHVDVPGPTRNEDLSSVSGIEFSFFNDIEYNWNEEFLCVVIMVVVPSYKVFFVN